MEALTAASFGKSDASLTAFSTKSCGSVAMKSLSSSVCMSEAPARDDGVFPAMVRVGTPIHAAMDETVRPAKGKQSSAKSIS